MKKFLLSLAAVVGLGFAANAAEVTLISADLGYANAQEVTKVETGDPNISIEFALGTSSTTPKYYTSGGAIRVYSGNTMTVTAATGYEITGVSSTTSSSYKFNGKVNDVKLSGNDWTGNAQEVIFQHTGFSQWRPQAITVTYTSTAAKDVEDVVITSEVENGEAVVTLSCATEGAVIKYGFVEDALDNVYTEPFKVTEKCTVYAQAELDGKVSALAQKAINLPAKFTTLKALVSESVAGESVVAVGNFSVVYQSSNTQYLIVTDGTSNALVYQPGTTYEVGTKFSQMMGTATIYSGMFELTGATLTEGGEGAEYMPAEVTSLSFDINENIFDEVIIKGCNVSGVSGKNATLSLGDETVALYNTFGIELDNTDNADVTAFVWRYNNNLQLAPISIEGKVVPVIENPVFEPASTELEAGEFITITCATEGVNIYYTIDGSEPTEESTLYTEPIEFTEDVTIKARAYSADADVEMVPSEVVEAVYTLFDPNKPVPNDVTFDFATLEGIDFGPDFVAPASGKGTDLDDPFTKDNITVSFTGGTTATRIWNKSGVTEFRVYKGGSITIAAPETYYLTKIEIARNNGTLTTTAPGTFESNVWTVADGDLVKEVTFNVTANVQIASINVSIDKTVGVEGVEVEDAAPVYYNLQGVRVENPSNGLFIVVRGNKATKQVIR